MLQLRQKWGEMLECVRGKRDSDGKPLTKRATEEKKNKSEHFCKTSCTELENSEIGDKAWGREGVVSAGVRSTLKEMMINTPVSIQSFNVQTVVQSWGSIFMTNWTGPLTVHQKG